MATPTRRLVTTTTGAENQKPVAILATNKIDTILGSIIQIDGRQSYDPEKQPITFKWSFTQVPLGSVVETAGFKAIRPNYTAVSFIPDKTGYYVVQLVVNDGELDSSPVTATVNIQLTRVPVGENIIPDAQFLWSYISDFWKLVEDREKVTSVWSSALQLVGTELIKLWGADYNKSLATIQGTFQRRWQQLSMVTDLKDVTDQRIIAGKTDDGIAGASGNIGEIPGSGNTSVFYVPLGNVGDGDRTDFTQLKGNYGAKGRVIVVDGDTYTISRVQNQDQSLTSGIDLVTWLATNNVTSASAPFEDVQVGDVLTIKSGANAGTYKVKQVTSPSALSVVWPKDPPGGPVPSFASAANISYTITRPFSSVVTDEIAIPDGLVNAPWRVPHLLHTPGLDLEADGVRAGDLLVFEVKRGDIGLSTLVNAQVVGADRDRLGFEFTTDELVPAVNSGSVASVVESGGIVTVSGLSGMRPNSVGGYLEILNGTNPGTYRISQYVSEDAVVIENKLASGADAGNPNIQWVERAKTGSNVQRVLFQQIVRDLRIMPVSAGDDDVAAAAEALISFMPVGINLNTRPFSKFGVTFTAKKIQHNSVMKVSADLVSAPVLQESVINPPVALRENFDYVIENGTLTFTSSLFTLTSPAPESFWAECAIFSNEQAVENNFGSLVELPLEDFKATTTRTPYLSAVRGLFFAYTNGPTVSNIRLGLQILLGLPFAEERGYILEVQDNFTVDTSGTQLGRMLVEDVDDNGQRLGIRRLYLYPTEVGLENNPATLVPYVSGDTISRFAPVSKGVEVVDYIKDPLWWRRALYGMEILKYFVFKVTVDSRVFETDDLQFALNFVKAIKPAYTRVLTAAMIELGEDITVADVFGGKAILKFYNSPWGLAATNRANDITSQGVVLWNTGSFPFHLRTPKLLRDVVTTNVSGAVRATSATGWDTSMIRARKTDPGSYGVPAEGRLPLAEGDILVILAGQPGAQELTPGMYEIEQVIDAHTLKLGWMACSVDFDQYQIMAPLISYSKPSLVASTFVYGSGLLCAIVRRETSTALWQKDLSTSSSTNVVTSALANFVKNHVRVGDRLCIEDGVNQGEYLIEALENKGSSATIAASVGNYSTVTGLANMTAASVGGVLEVLNGANKGHYKITSYISASSVQIRTSTAVLQTSVQWRERPKPPYISDTQVSLKDMDGNPVVLSTLTNQNFRVIRPFMFRPEVFAFRIWWDPTPGELRLNARTLMSAGDQRDIFTPGMAGRYIWYSESTRAEHNGKWMITRYINSAEVIVNAYYSFSDTDDTGVVNFLGVA